MKAVAFVLLFVIYSIECRKQFFPIDKNANVDFINMEGGGGVRPAPRPGVQPLPAPAPAPITPPSKIPVTPPTAKLPPVTPPVAPPATTVKTVQPNVITPRPVNPTPATKPITTPGPGTVKQLVNFYDSQGKASPIRPYSYSQAVKQG